MRKIAGEGIVVSCRNSGQGPEGSPLLSVEMFHNMVDLISIKFLKSSIQQSDQVMTEEEYKVYYLWSS